MNCKKSTKKINASVAQIYTKCAKSTQKSTILTQFCTPKALGGAYNCFSNAQNRLGIS